MPTNFSLIQFYPEEHRYFLDGRELTGVNRKLKEVQKPFDREGKAKGVAEREGRSIESVLKDWDTKGERSRNLGIAVHEHIKNTLCRNGHSNDPFLSLNTKAPEMVIFDNFWSELASKVKYDPGHIEWIIGDSDLGLAGTLDSLFYSPETGRYHIWDWKTGNFETYNKWGNLLKPFDYLDSSKLNIYSLQVSLYRLIIERNTDLVLGDSYIVHLSPQLGHQVHKALDLRAELLQWLTH